MRRFVLNTQEVDEEAEDRLINILRPKLSYICYNPVRAGILHLMVKSPELNHALSVEEISRKLGKRHSVIIHHLEKLKEWDIVEVVKSSKYGIKQRRKIWGLNLKYPNLIAQVYSHLLRTFFTASDLKKICSVNRNVRTID